MNFTDIFIKRPVLATVISLIILVLGLRAVFSLTIRQFPETQSATVTISTAYYGASPEAIAGFVTAPIEAAVSQAQGIDYISSSSVSGVSTINVVLRLNYDSNKALTDINTKINSVRGQLPAEAQSPQITVSTGETTAAMYINFASNEMPGNSITDYLQREVKPKLQTLPGIKSADILGARNFALRAWLDPTKLAGFGLTASDVFSALATQNYISGLGKTRGMAINLDFSASTDLKSLDEFRQVVVKRKGNTVVRLEDIANVHLGAESYESTARFDGVRSVFMGITVAPDANLLDAIAEVRKVFPSIQRQLPPSLIGSIVYDSTKFVNSSIYEVIKTLAEALIIVTLVIYLFLGNVRAVIVPLVAMPLSLIGSFFIMLWLGYTINLLTLLSLVLAIGLVVDDAIIVVENVDRHLKAGLSAVNASLKAARELTGPIISMTVVLIAVYVPIGFQGGLTGSLFTEFAFTLAGAVTISGIVALTLSPMMCSRMLHNKPGKFQHRTDQFLEWLRYRYQQTLRNTLTAWKVPIVFGFLILLLIVVMVKLSKSELAPEEDRGFAFSIASASPNASLTYMEDLFDQIYAQLDTIPEKDHVVQFARAGSNTGFSGVVMKPWDERERDAKAIIQEMQAKLKNVAGVKAFVISPPALPGGGGGPPFQMIIKTTEPFVNLNQVVKKIVKEGQASGNFFFINSSLKIDKLQIRVEINRDRAASMGLTMRDIGGPLSALLGGGYVNYFNLEGRAYKVIPQISQLERLTPEQLNDYYIRNSSGKLIPASSVVTLKKVVVPQTLNRFGQLNSATIQGVPNAFKGVSMGDAIALMTEIAQKNMPSGYSIDFAGVSRQTVQESNTFAATMIFALLIIFLVLAAQFESFRDPIIIMASVPMAIFGAMVFIFLGATSLNIYTQVGLVTLVGLISRHGILIVEFANDAQRKGMNKFDAILTASGVRLRPILMTTAATILGVLPLVLASGAGAVGRFSMGIVIAAGLFIGTLFTLFVVPAMYMWLGSDYQKKTTS